jgi:hypothetical protein
MRLGSHLDHAVNVYGRGPSVSPRNRPRTGKSTPYAITQTASTIALISSRARGR